MPLLVVRNLIPKGGSPVETGGQRPRPLTKGLATWNSRLTRAGARELQPWGLFRLARLYLRRQSEDKSAADLDQFVALSPWKSELEWDIFERALDQGWIEIPPDMEKWYAKAVFIELLEAAGVAWLRDSSIYKRGWPKQRI